MASLSRNPCSRGPRPVVARIRASVARTAVATAPDRYDRFVTTLPTINPGFGTGIYSFSEAARILAHRSPEVRAGRLRRWAAGGLTPPSFGESPGVGTLLSFHDLVSLEVVRRFRVAGVSLQRLRKLETGLRDMLPNVARPFAQQLFFTDGASVWVGLGEPDGAAIELVGQRSGHYVWRPAIKTFASEIRFGSENQAVAWELSDRIEIDPGVQFGEPVVKGTRLPISVIARELSGHSLEEIADWHAIDVEDVRDVCHFLAA